jgi:hypothetical protein
MTDQTKALAALDRFKQLANGARQRPGDLVAIKRLADVARAHKRMDLTMEQYEEAISDMPLTDEEKAIYQRTYDRILAEVSDTTMAHQLAMGAVRRSRLDMPVKSFKVGRDYLVKGWGILFGDPSHRDTDDEYFHPDTRFYFEMYGTSPLWVEHGFDSRYGVEPVGSRVDAERYKTGWYVIHRLDPEHTLFQRTIADVRAGIYGYSVDSFPQFKVKNRRDGELAVFPVGGFSLVNFPAEPGLGAVALVEPTVMSDLPDGEGAAAV